MTQAHLELLDLTKQVRDTQIAYFASGTGRFRDRKLLKLARHLEGELDKLIDAQVAMIEPIGL
ncbi:hypothetical protein [Fibrella aquatilis]|uniref:Uncharacterized protein n=1 Tax=Fibrella aquatilis TaxID=2817059 RepID=A0A939GBP0_9BACT|nr:hypothetical protein [Fibrella aquatilis]MBO0933900.1 hypothetical protein [Fibrella aquatilis]